MNRSIQISGRTLSSRTQEQVAAVVAKDPAASGLSDQMISAIAAAAVAADNHEVDRAETIINGLLAKGYGLPAGRMLQILHSTLSSNANLSAHDGIAVSRDGSFYYLRNISATTEIRNRCYEDWGTIRSTLGYFPTNAVSSVTPLIASLAVGDPAVPIAATGPMLGWYVVFKPTITQRGEFSVTVTVTPGAAAIPGSPWTYTAVPYTVSLTGNASMNLDNTAAAVFTLPFAANALNFTPAGGITQVAEANSMVNVGLASSAFSLASGDNVTAYVYPLVPTAEIQADFLKANQSRCSRVGSIYEHFSNNVFDRFATVGKITN